MRVWRVETEAGIGPYRLRSEDGQSVLDGTISEKHPSPCSDPKLQWDTVNHDSYRFAFANKAAYKAWFSKTMRDCVRAETKLSVYKVKKKHVLFGEKQLIFKRSKAKLVKRTPL